MAQGVPFIVTEIPNAHPFMLHIYAAVAEQERTKDRLSAPGRPWRPPRLGVSSSATRTGPKPFTAEIQRQGSGGAAPGRPTPGLSSSATSSQSTPG